jgi:hypothetical protein
MAQYHVFNLAGFQLRHARQRAIDGHRGQLVGTRRAQRAFDGLAGGSADSGDNHCIFHSCQLELLKIS